MTLCREVSGISSCAEWTHYYCTFMEWRMNGKSASYLELWMEHWGSWIPAISFELKINRLLVNIVCMMSDWFRFLFFFCELLTYLFSLWDGSSEQIVCLHLRPNVVVLWCTHCHNSFANFACILILPMHFDWFLSHRSFENWIRNILCILFPCTCTVSCIQWVFGLFWESVCIQLSVFVIDMGTWMRVTLDIGISCIQLHLHETCDCFIIEGASCPFWNTCITYASIYGGCLLRLTSDQGLTKSLNLLIGDTFAHWGIEFSAECISKAICL